MPAVNPNANNIIISSPKLKNMNYSARIDKIFGGLYTHRTLRTIFDTDAAEWGNTTMVKKVEILTKILDSGYPLSDWIRDYLAYYKKLKKEYVRSSLPAALAILRQNTTDTNIIQQIDLYSHSNHVP